MRETESTEQINTIDKVETKIVDNGILAKLLVHWNFYSYIQDDEMSDSNQTIYTANEEELSVVYQGLPSNLDGWLNKNQPYFVLLAKQKADDLTKTEKEKLIDYETGRAIDSRVHPASGIEEQIAIMRDLLTQNINAGLLNSTEEFDRFNEIAVEEVEAGQSKKRDL